MDAKNSRRRCVNFSLACLLVAAILPLGCSKKPPPQPEVPRPIKLMTISDAGLCRELSRPASVKAFREAKLSFLVPGRLETIDVLRGQTVVKGQQLASLDPRDYQNRLNAAKADENQKKIYLDRIRRAMAKGAATETEEEQAVADFKVAEAQRKIQAKALADTVLTAPFKGEIGKQYKENFQDVAAKEKVFLLQDISKLKIVIDISESTRIMVVESVRNGDDTNPNATSGGSTVQPGVQRRGKKSSAVAVFDDLPGDSFPLTFYEEDQSADPDTRTYAVTFLMDPPVTGLILPGMSATVKGRFRLKSAAANDAYTVPVSAVFSAPDSKRYVWVYEPAGKDAEFGTVHKRQVTVKSIQGDKIEIIEKFALGTQIAISGVNYLKDGMKVKPLTFKSKRDAE